MKWNQSLSVAAIAAFALGASACDDGLAELNENPNAPKDVPAQVVLPEAIANTIELAYGGGFNLEFTELFAQHWAKIQYTEEDRFELRPGSIDNWWTTFYASALADWDLIIQKGQTEVPIRPNHEATGRVMRAFTGHIMTDIWGDIPWSEALRGDDEEPIITPAYDPQSEIYTALISELDTALGLFDPAGTTWGSEDLLFGGDIDQWMRFANSLKLRLAVRASGNSSNPANTAQATAWIEEALAHPAGLIDENAENAKLTFLTAAPNQNPLYENWVGGRDDHAVSKTLVDMMGALNDPRLPVYAEPAANDSVAMGGHVVYEGDVYRGMPNGVPESEIPPIATISRIGEHWRSHTNAAAAATPAFLLTAAEVHFLLAEIAQRGLAATGGTAAGHYVDGITASMEMWADAHGSSIDAGAITAYLGQAGVAYGTGDSPEEQIAEQKWLALYTNGPEAYAETRRTGFPDEITIRAGHTLDHVPGRIPYPNIEQALNADNWNAARTAQGNDGTYTGGVWWDPDSDDVN